VALKKEERGVVLSHRKMPKRAAEREPQRCTLVHDVTNCVAIIVGECELLADLISNNPEALERLTMISKTARRMASDIRQRSCPINC
jgi:hypothetical protein